MSRQREHWGSKLGFILAAIGSAIGLGTLWKFPYVTGENGGGLFVLIYLFCTLFIGLPVFVAELMLGRKAQRGVVGIFSSLSDHSKNWRMVGWLAILAPLLILSFYNVVAGWGLNYIFLSLNGFTTGKDPNAIRGVFEAMYHSGSICLFFQFLFTSIVVGMVYQGVQKGIEHWAKIMTIGLFLILLGLFAYTVTLKGFPEALHFVFAPDLSKLKPSGALTALGLAFFTLSLGHGVMLTYGSYLKEESDLPKAALVVGIADVVVSILAALMIFPIIFTFGFEPDQKAGLIFQTLPILFQQLPGTLIISTTFFILFVFTALTSAIALLEVIIANLMDLYSWSRHKATLWAGIVVFLLGIPCSFAGSKALSDSWSLMSGKSVFETMDYIVSVWILPLSGLFTSFFVGWKLERAMIREEFCKGAKWKWLFRPWLFFMRYVVPLAILLVLCQEAELINLDRWMHHTPSQ